MANVLRVEVDEKTMKALVAGYFEEKTGQVFEEKEITIEVKSKQNWRSEWEPAAFRARIEKHL